MFEKILSLFGYTKVKDPKDSKYNKDDELFKYIQRLPPDYFVGMEEDMLEYTEDMAYKALEERKISHDKIREDARKTLSLLLGGVGVSLSGVFTILCHRCFIINHYKVTR